MGYRMQLSCEGGDLMALVLLLPGSLLQGLLL